MEQILAADKKANVVVLGDINDFEFSETTEILEGGELSSLLHLLPKAERYSYVFEGNSQVLDQILALRRAPLRRCAASTSSTSTPSSPTRRATTTRPWRRFELNESSG